MIQKLSSCHLDKCFVLLDSKSAFARRLYIAISFQIQLRGIDSVVVPVTLLVLTCLVGGHPERASAPLVCIARVPELYPGFHILAKSFIADPCSFECIIACQCIDVIKAVVLNQGMYLYYSK
jgi:hypothetical protein